MTFTNAIFAGFRNYAKFNGRATRPEYWWFYLFNFLVTNFVTVLGRMVHPSLLLLNLVVALGLLLPMLSVGVRRLHDTNRSGWWLLLTFTIIGIIPLVIWLASRGDEGDNRFGLPPAA